MASSVGVFGSPFDDPMLAAGVLPNTDGQGAPSGGLETATNTATVAGDLRSAVDPGRPLFWGLALLGTTFGLIFASTSIRVGPVRASVSAGRSEGGNK